MYTRIQSALQLEISRIVQNEHPVDIIASDVGSHPEETINVVTINLDQPTWPFSSTATTMIATCT
jgi:hypothetical protein